MRYQIYALKLGELDAPASFVLYRTESREDMRLFYYFWCIKKSDGFILVDTGFTPAMARQRGIKNYLNPVEQLNQVGIDAKSADKIIITHLHYDHFGGYEYFPNATFYIQKREVNGWSNEPLSDYGGFRSLVRREFISGLKKLANRGKVKLLNGDKELFEDINVILTGGHSPGLQFVTVQIGSRKVVLTSDVCHLHENLEQNTPSSIFVNLVDSLNALKKVRTYSRDIIIPSHAPETSNKFQKLSESVVRIV